MVHKVKQRDISDCGPACIMSIVRYYHLFVPLSEIRKYAQTSKSGTSILGLIRALTYFGFDAEGVHSTANGLRQIPLPAIAHIEPEKLASHFVVIRKVMNSTVEIMDPADGRFHRYSSIEFNSKWTGKLIIIKPSKSFKTTVKHKSSYRRLWKLIKNERRGVAVIIVLALLYTALGLSLALYSELLFDTIIPERNTSILIRMSIAMIVGIGLQSIFLILKNFQSMKSAESIDRVLATGYLRHLFFLPQEFFDSMRTGEILSRISDVFKIRTFITELVSTIVITVFVIALSFGLMISKNYKLATINHDLK